MNSGTEPTFSNLTALGTSHGGVEANIYTKIVMVTSLIFTFLTSKG